MTNQKLSVILLALLAIALTLTLIGRYSGVLDTNNDQQALAELGFFRFDHARELADIPLKNLEGDTVSLTGRHQQWQLVNFGYMYCPDICPINLRFLADLKTSWDANGAQPAFAITHITFDPERDTPNELKSYLDYHSTDYSGLTGELDNIQKVAQQLNYVFIHQKPDEYGNYLISHSDSIALINPQGEFVGMFKGPYEKEKSLEVLKKIL